MEEILPGIFQIHLYSEADARGRRNEINIFIVKGKEGERSLMVDAGYHTQENKDLMPKLLDELGVPIDKLDIFLTHKHHDHTGLANFYAQRGAVIYMNPEEDRHPYDCLYYNNSPKALEEQKIVLHTIGVHKDLTPNMWYHFMKLNRTISKDTESMYFKEQHAYEYLPIYEGQIFSYGRYNFEAFNLRGHTYGQMGLIDFDRKYVFSADQIIDGINPIVGTAYVDEHLLDLYFKSLEWTKIGFYGYQIMPAHGKSFTSTGRIAEHILNAYRRKLDEIREVLRDAEQPLTVKEVAFLVYNADCQEADEKLMQMKMYITKTFSCLEYLHDCGEVVRKNRDGILYWTRPGFERDMKRLREQKKHARLKFFVTGVGGQLGHDIMNELIKRGHEGIGSDVHPEYEGIDDGSEVTRAPYVQLDITDSEAVRRVIREAAPDAVIHCAAWTAVDMAEDSDKAERVRAVNAGGTANIAGICRELGCRMTYISTDYVFNGQGTEPWDPDSKEYSPLNFYGQTKLEGELAVADALEKYFIVRTAWVFGLNGSNFIKTMLTAGKKHDSVRVVTDQVGTPTYSIDLARFLIDLNETDKYGYYHVTNEGGYISWYDFTKEIYRQAGYRTRVIPVTTEEYGLSKAKRPSNSRLDRTKIIRNGFEPLPIWQDAVSRYLETLKLVRT